MSTPPEGNIVPTGWGVLDSRVKESVSSTQTPEKSSLSASTQEAEPYDEDLLTTWLMSAMTKKEYLNRKKMLWNCYHKQHPKYDDACFTDNYAMSSFKYIYNSIITTETDNYDFTFNALGSGTITPTLSFKNWYQVSRDMTNALQSGFGEPLGDSDSVKTKPAFSKIAIRRSERLLDRMLSSKQRKYWHRNRYIDVRSPAYPERLYRIPEYGKVLCFDSGKLTKRLCIYSIDRLPLADKILSLKVMIESDEQEFLRIAIPHSVGPYTNGVMYSPNVAPLFVGEQSEDPAIEMGNGMAMKNTAHNRTIARDAIFEGDEKRMVIMATPKSMVTIVNIGDDEDCTEEEAIA